MLEKLSKKYKFENGMFVHATGRYAGEGVDKKRILGELVSYGCPPEELTEKLQELSQLCKAKPADNSADNSEIIQQIIAENDFISEFRIVKLRKDVFTYIYKENKAELVQVGYPGTMEWVEHLLKYKNEEIMLLRNRLKDYMNPKAPQLVTPEKVAEQVAVGLNFSLRDDLKVVLDDDLRPITLSTSPEMSLCKLEYEEQEDASFNKLNPYMAEFITRVSDHEYLCATIWLMVQGIKTPYVVYLLGKSGGEGKSSFINAVAKRIESFHSFEDNNQFSNFHMYGKAMIILAENKDCYLLQKRTVKALTGGSALSCEQKGKGSFTGFLAGMLFVDSNHALKIKGEDYETRRLKLFRVSHSESVIRHDQQTYTALLSEDFNSFINYCRICFEKVGDSQSNLVPNSATQIAEFPTMIDPEFKHVSETVLGKMFKDLNLEYCAEGSISSDLLFQSFYKTSEANKKYAWDNLKEYLSIHKKVRSEGAVFTGIRQKSIYTEHTSFVMPTT